MSKPVKIKINPREKLFPLSSDKFADIMVEYYGYLPERTTIWKWRKKGMPAFYNGPRVLLPETYVGSIPHTSEEAMRRFWRAADRICKQYQW